MDVRKKNTYEVLDMIEKNLISESDIIYYIENDYLDNQLLEDVMDNMFSEYGEYSAVNGNKPSVGLTRWLADKIRGDYDSSKRSNDPMAIALGKNHEITKSVAKSTGISNHVEPNPLPKDIFNKNPLDGIALKSGLSHEQKLAIAANKVHNAETRSKFYQEKANNSIFKSSQEKADLEKSNLEKAKQEYKELADKGGEGKSIKDIGVTKSKEQIDDDLKKEIAKLHEKNATQAKSVEKHAEAPKPVKVETPKQTETKVETSNNGHTETQKPGGGEDHTDGIWEKIKGGYHTIKKAAGEHLDAAKKYAMEHPGVAGAAAAGAAVAGLAAYAGYKHLKNKKALASAHEDAHKAAMDSISKTHGHLSGAAAAHIHNDIHNVINSNKEMFKKDPRKSKEQLINHFGSDEYKKHLISKLSK